MTEPLFLAAPYARTCEAVVTAHVEGGVVLDRTVLYAAGGGQPGDTGTMGGIAVTDTVKGEGGAIVHRLDGAPPPVGDAVAVALDWERRHRHMRMHTALHLLSVVIPLPVTGGQIGEAKSRLDFDMAEAPQDKGALEAELNALAAADHAVSSEWIEEAELDANPGLVKTLRVQPPRGAGRIRLVRIGERVDLQPCGGTHVARTAEIGAIRLGKIEKKGRQNRRISITLDA